jgi:hypothetical protein
MKLIKIAVLACVLGTPSIANAATIFWTDWTASVSGGAGFTGVGTILTPTSTVAVTYNNPNGVGFFHTGAPGEIDYWKPNGGVRNPAISPYTSDLVDNIPTGTDIVGLQFAGSQTLTFSQTIANPVFSYVSLNGNGYAFFDQDFEILSFGHPIDGNECGYWGCGTSFKNIVLRPDGTTEYQLLGTGEPHGTIRFTGAFDTLTWRSLSNEFWNGFTVGVQGTAIEVFPETSAVPEPASMLLLGSGLGIAARRLRRRS